MTTDPKSVAQSWQRIRNWYEANISDQFRERLKNTAPPATMDEIAACEDSLGITLPDSVRESYLLYNGDGAVETFSFGPLISLKQIVALWNRRRALLENGYDLGSSIIRCNRAIRKKSWDLKWIPITDDMSGDFFCIDQNPTKYGVSGQIIRFLREQGPVDRVANSFTDMLLTFAERLEAGKYQWSDEHEGVRPVTGTFSDTI